MKNIFNRKDTDTLINRINALNVNTNPSWGSMNVAQMLAHTSIIYELIYDNKHPKPKGLMKFFLKTFVKPMVVGKKPYKKNSKTAPVFLIKGKRDFEHEKERLINYINKTQALGETYFHGKESHSFGKLTKDEWNVMMYKHLDHHLTQFGV